MTILTTAERGQMAFAHDTEVSLAATAALVNTGRDEVESLPDVAALDAFIAAVAMDGQQDARRSRTRGCDRAAGQAGRALGADRR